jgi:PAS domain S-box-containing protein
MLERHGYAVHVVHSGEDALSHVRSDPAIDLILMDIDLGSGIDGTEAAGRILADYDIPIVFLTSHTEPEFVERVKEITGYGYVVKNSGEFVLVQSIDMALRLCEAHNQMAQEKERYRSLVENTNDAVVIHDFDGIITFVNRRAAGLLGYSEHELLGMSLETLHSPRGREQVQSLMARSDWPERTLVETELVTKAGEAIPVEVSAVIASYTDGGEIQAFVRDIRGRKEAETAFRAVYDQTDEAIAMFDRDGRILQINRAAARPFGEDPSALVGRTLTDLHDRESAAEALSGLREVFETGRSRTAEFHTQIAGRKRWFHVHTEPVRDSQEGHVSYVVTFSTDVTELKEAEENYRLIAEHARDVVAVIDAEFTPIYISPSAQRLFGYSMEDFDGTTVFDFVHEDDVDGLVRDAKAAIERGVDGATRRFRVVAGSGEIKSVEVDSTYLYGEDGHLLKMIQSIRDITREEQMQAELQHTAARLEATLDAMPELFFELDGDLRFRDVRAPDTGALYADPSEVLGARAADILPKEVAEQLSQAIERTDGEQTPATFDYSLSHDDENRFFRASVARESSGEADRYVVVVREVTDLVRAREELEESLGRNRHLLREMHHRVKNNLALVSSLVSLKTAASDDVDLSDLQSQIEAVRFAHEQLQLVEDDDSIDLRSYLEQLTSRVFASMAHYPVRYELDVDHVHVASKTAVSIGLLVNELATNAVKHAFGPESSNEFSVSLTDRGEELYLEVSNTGAPLPEHVTLESPSGLGMQLVAGLAQQLGGSATILRRNDPAFAIRIPNARV